MHGSGSGPRHVGIIRGCGFELRMFKVFCFAYFGKTGLHGIQGLGWGLKAHCLTSGVAVFGLWVQGPESPLPDG